MTYETWLQAIRKRSLELYGFDFVDYFKGHPFRQEYEEVRSVEFMTAKLTKWIPVWKEPLPGDRGGARKEESRGKAPASTLPKRSHLHLRT